MFDIWLAGCVATYFYLLAEGARRGMEPRQAMAFIACIYWPIFLPVYWLDLYLNDGNKKGR